MIQGPNLRTIEGVLKQGSVSNAQLLSEQKVALEARLTGLEEALAQVYADKRNV